PEKSQHVIFGSYLLNSLPKEDSCLLKGVPCDRTFCIAAEKALAPGGRLILVQDKLQEKFLQEIAGKLGLKIHAITIADEQAIKSKSPAVRMRSSPQKRIKFTKSELARMHLDTGKYLKGLKKLGIHNIEEATRPTIFLLRKSRKAKTRLESEIQDMNLVSQLIKGMFRQRE
ncbi:MAG: hypothetical protein NTY48_02355, partial [Candidatus Diapherotrites archaeon]|nr:hypothetical protein [Candidatus Diapherotrites archaeon]